MERARVKHRWRMCRLRYMYMGADRVGTEFRSLGSEHVRSCQRWASGHVRSCQIGSDGVSRMGVEFRSLASTSALSRIVPTLMLSPTLGELLTEEEAKLMGGAAAIHMSVVQRVRHHPST